MEKETTLNDLRELLEDNLTATEENTKMLRKMRRDALIGGILKFALWVIVIVVSFYFSMQFIDPLMKSFEGADGASGGAKVLIDLYTGNLEQ